MRLTRSLTTKSLYTNRKKKPLKKASVDKYLKFEIVSKIFSMNLLKNLALSETCS